MQLCYSVNHVCFRQAPRWEEGGKGWASSFGLTLGFRGHTVRVFGHPGEMQHVAAETFTLLKQLPAGCRQHRVLKNTKMGH